MNLEYLSLTLAPLALLSIWSMFVISSDLVLSLFTLLLTSLVLPLLYMQYYKLFWPCGLLLILMSTGLIIIFAYIVSLCQKKEKLEDKVLLFSLLFLTSAAYFKFYSSPVNILNTYWKVDVSPSLSLMLFFLLLFLVVNFIRIVYSKGGGFRKKF